MSMTLSPGIVTMRDTAGQVYLVDETLSFILLNRHVWTDMETGQIMVDDVRYRQKQTVTSHLLAVWWYRIMSLNDLPSDLTIAFKDGNKRNLIYKNLVRLAKGDVTRHDTPTQTPDSTTPGL